MSLIDDVNKFLVCGKNDDALALLDTQIKINPDDDELYYLKGKIYHKQQDWKNAIENYQHAVYLNEGSPARDTLKLVNKILLFYNKDVFNQ